jgi:hypothetical protein
MLKSVTYLCPSCNGSFRQLIDTKVEQPPRFCALCGFDVQGEMQEGISCPAIGRSIAKSADNVYRAMEQGAEFRAGMARETMGLSEAEANVMKITDMRDNARVGETSEMPVVNPVSQAMAAAPAGAYGFQGAAGLGYSSSVAEGPFPNAGAHAQAAVRATHAQYAATSGQAGAVVSSMPALETTMPGYRRRVG